MNGLYQTLKNSKNIPDHTAPCSRRSIDHNVDKKGQPPVEEQMLQVSAIVIVSERERSEEEEDRGPLINGLFTFRP